MVKYVKFISTILASASLLTGCGGSTTSDTTTYTPPSGTTPPPTSKFTRDNTKEVVIDSTLNLVWQDDEASKTVKKQWLTDEKFTDCADNYIKESCLNTVGDTASTYCSQLVLGEYTNWRLPTVKEILSIMAQDEYPAINPAFVNAVPEIYWTSESDSPKSFYGMAGNFDFPVSGTSYKNNSLNVRCVKSLK